MYQNISQKRDKALVLRFPIFLMHRMMYAVVASVFYLHITFAIQIIVLMNLFHAMYVFNFRQNASKSQIRLDRFTEGTLHMMFLQLFLYTDFVTNPNARLYFCLVYIGCICLVLIVNLGYMLTQGILKFLRLRNLSKLQKKPSLSVD